MRKIAIVGFKGGIGTSSRVAAVSGDLGIVQKGIGDLVAQGARHALDGFVVERVVGVEEAVVEYQR